MYTRRYIPAASGPMDRPTMYNVRRSCGVRDPGRRFWRRVGHKVTGSRRPLVRSPSPGPSSPQTRASSLLPRPLIPRITGGVVKVILPGVKATRTSQKQYDFIAIARARRGTVLHESSSSSSSSPSRYLASPRAWHSSGELATLFERCVGSATYGWRRRQARR